MKAFPSRTVVKVLYQDNLSKMSTMCNVTSPMISQQPISWGQKVNTRQSPILKYNCSKFMSNRRQVIPELEIYLYIITNMTAVSSRISRKKY